MTVERPSIAVSFWLQQPVRLGFTNTESAMRRMAEQINNQMVTVAEPDGLTLASGLTVSSGSGAPTHAAAKGSFYLRSDGSTTNNRAYINTDGSTTWTALTTVA